MIMIEVPPQSGFLFNVLCGFFTSMMILVQEELFILIEIEIDIWVKTDSDGGDNFDAYNKKCFVIPSLRWIGIDLNLLNRRNHSTLTTNH